MQNRGKLLEPKTTWAAVKAEYEKAEIDVKNETDEIKKKQLERTLLLKLPLYEAMKKVEDATVEVQNKKNAFDNAATGKDETLQGTTKIALDEAKEKLAKLQDAAAREESVGSVKGEQELELKTALTDIYTHEKLLREANEEKDKAKADQAQINLEVAETRWKNANEALQAIGTKDSVASLEVDGMKTMKTTIKGHLTSLNSEINDLQVQLGSTGAGLANAPNVITGVTKDNALVHASDDAFTQSGFVSTGFISTEEESADVWTKVSFSVGTESDSSSTQESHVSGSANLQVGNW